MDLQALIRLQRAGTLTPVRYVLGLEALGYTTGESPCFDTISVTVPVEKTEDLLTSARAKQINLRAIDATHIGISLDETTTPTDVEELQQIFAEVTAQRNVPTTEVTAQRNVPTTEVTAQQNVPTTLQRKSPLSDASRFQQLSL